MGRKSLIHNKLIRDTILELIANGNYIKTACMAAGISEVTYYDWIKKAERCSNSNGNGRDEDSVYLEFLNRLKIAEAENIGHNVKNIQDAADNDSRNWMASAWILERKYPSEYGRRLELEVGPSKILIALREEAQELTGIKQIATVVSDSNGTIAIDND